MVGALAHRGPDGIGFHFGAGIALAHARLSIIDLESGQQPIHNEDESIWVVFNGEIFNYVELRHDLEQAGHRFYTHSDTEVLVHLYEQYGDEFVFHLNGQFAIALWDARRRRLLLIRDRVGIEPLFYVRSHSHIAFASEVKALLTDPGITTRLDPIGLDQVFTFWSTVGSRTMFSGISQIQPGEMLCIEGGRAVQRRYWDWSFPIGRIPRIVPEKELAETAHDLLADATRIRLRADVPVGAYLSGGLDSAIIAALIREQRSEFQTFSISFDDAGHDESGYQRKLSSFFGTRHNELRCSVMDIGHDFPSAVWHAESPILRTAPVPMKRLSRSVRDNRFKVVLTGEGADEVFAGYDIFKESAVRRFWARNPSSTWRPRLFERLYGYLHLSPARSRTYAEEFFGQGLKDPEQPFFSHLPRWSLTSRCKEFFSTDVVRMIEQPAVDAFLATLPAEFTEWNALARAQYLEAKTLLPGYLLSSQGDRMLMANGVEGRFPFLDHRVIEFAARLPSSLKMQGLREKYLLRRSMRERLPLDILRREKQPYRAPDGPPFLGAAGRAIMDEMLADSCVRQFGYFDPVKVGFLHRKVVSGRPLGVKDSMALVGILSTQLWHRAFIEKKDQTISGAA